MHTVYTNYQLQPHNTFRVKAIAQHFTRVDSIDALQALLRHSDYQDLPKRILGGGSNVLLTTDFSGLMIHNNLRGITCIRENDAYVWLNVGAGEIWHEFVLYCLRHHYAGIENLSLIPGTVGAAPIQNIGAYGVEFESVFESLNAIDLSSGQLRCFDKQECAFGYRDSIFKNECAHQYLITDVTLKLHKTPRINISYSGIQQILDQQGIQQPAIHDISRAVIHLRQQKLPDPNTHPNAGSFFKNPRLSLALFQTLKASFPDIPSFMEGTEVKVPAAWFIESCGLKGLTREGVGVSPSHALVLINYQGDSGQAIQELAQHIQDTVEVKFGIRLQTEVNVW